MLSIPDIDFLGDRSDEQRKLLIHSRSFSNKAIVSMAIKAGFTALIQTPDFFSAKLTIHKKSHILEVDSYWLLVL
jgi:hypothetical protein